MKSEIVINYHANSACNYGCHYCYSEWEHENNMRELWQDNTKLTAMLYDVYHFFRCQGFESIRLNLAGGEPLLIPQLGRIIEVANLLGYKVSIITNGSRTTNEFIQRYGMRLSTYGVSIDTINPDTSLKIQRCSKNGSVLDFEKLADQIRMLRTINPDCKIKINTVVNQYNYREDFSQALLSIQPDKWKIFQVLPSLRKTPVISKQQFHTYINRHSKFSDIWTVEDNELMTGSYIMIDPFGRFFDNSQTEFGYVFSDPILRTGAEQAFSQVQFDFNKFQSRYNPTSIGSQVAC